MTEDQRKAAVKRSIPLALAYLLFDYAVYLGLLAVALRPLPLAASLGVGVACGLFIGNVFTLGHDGAHQSLTNSRSLNHWIARFAFLPAMHSLSLWIPGHNHLHHTFTNLRGADYTWEPMSPADYRQATPLRRALYRLYRSPFGSFPYYFFEIWLRRSVLPLSAEDRKEWRIHLFDSAFVVVGNIALVLGIVWLGRWLAPARPAWLTVVLGWAVPFLAWNWIIGWVVFMQHTHPEVGWYADKREWTFFRGQILATVQARLPPVMNAFSNNIMEHNAHHSYPMIPLYRLRPAQALLRAAYPQVRALTLTPRAFVRQTRACKLFDYQRRQWVDFDGTPTGPVIPLDGLPPATARAPGRGTGTQA